jgi:hypothetical protein
VASLHRCHLVAWGGAFVMKTPDAGMLVFTMNDALNGLLYISFNRHRNDLEYSTSWPPLLRRKALMGWTPPDGICVPKWWCRPFT